MPFWTTILLLFLGALFYHFVASSKYIFTGKFKFQKWWAENGAPMIWGLGICFFFSVFYFFNPEGIAVWFATLGIEFVDVSADTGEQSTNLLPPSILGYLLMDWSRRVLKKAREQVEAKEKLANLENKKDA